MDNEVERIIIQNLVTVYANARSWHSLETPQQALNQHLERGTSNTQVRQRHYYYVLPVLGKEHYLQCCNITATKRNITNCILLMKTVCPEIC